MCGVDDKCNSEPVLTRRQLMLSGAGALLAASLSAPAFSLDAAAQSADGVDGVAPDEAWARLMAGNERFATDARICTDYAIGRASLTSSQHPFAAVLGCADSRVVPEMAFDQMPGDLFAVRVAGNFVSDDGVASLEYAVKYLGTRLIVVLGHSNCGAVDAAIKVVRDHAELPGHLLGMLREIRPAAEQALASSDPDVLDYAIRQNVRNAVERLQIAGPILGPDVASGRVKVIGATYDLASGRVTALA